MALDFCHCASKHPVSVSILQKINGITEECDILVLYVYGQLGKLGR